MMTMDTLTLGHFNAHDSAWYSSSTVTRGTLLENMISGSNFGILKWDSPTRLPGNANPTSTDVSLAAASLLRLTFYSSTLMESASGITPQYVRTVPMATVFIHESITFSKQPSSPETLSDPHLEELTIKADIGNTKLIISNIYIPPASSCSNGYQSSIEHLLTTPDTLILGDFNAHHPSWYSRSTDTRGKRMDDSINGSNYGILNWDSPTRVPPNEEQSSPDVSLASTSLITSCSWQTLSTLSSDHLPILIRLQMKTTSTPGLRRTYVNLKKANWDRYRQEVETALSKRSLPTDCQRDEKIFRTVLLKAASHHIPTGRHRLHEEPVPAEILDVMTRRDDLRKRDPTSPELPRLNYDIQNRIYAHKRQKWRDFVETLDQKTDVTKLWRTIKGIDGRAKREAENEAITFNGISFSSSKQLATKFNQQFNTSKLGRHTSSGETGLLPSYLVPIP